ncbi:MAG TPA: NYN domain-containing protein [Phycisphaeraceae bacterium]
MPLLIDCYNVLHAPMPPALAGLDVPRLEALLARTVWAREGVWLYCDGQPTALGPGAGSWPGVEVVYAGAARTADDLIIERVERDTAPRRLIVVSSDREIRRAARRRRAVCWTSPQFIGYLQAALRQGSAGSASKPADAPLAPEQVDQWLRVFGYDPGPADSSSDPGSAADEEEDDSAYWPPW